MRPTIASATARPGRVLGPFLAVLGALALAGPTAGCGGSSGGSGRCTPGVRFVCTCPGGTVAAQVCQADGTYGACPCSGAGADGGALDGPGADGGAQLDSGAPPDGAVQTDAPWQSDAPQPLDAAQHDAPAALDAIQHDATPPHDGPPPLDAPAPHDGPPAAACCAAGSQDQTFEQGMCGCKGTVTFANRASLCGTGFRVCTAAEWVARRGGAAPSYDYWTNDVLYTAASGRDQSCSVHLNYQLLDYCDPTVPMRVCSGYNDPLGNSCNWTQCGYNQTTPQDYFGGCQGNTTAGAICCPN